LCAFALEAQTASNTPAPPTLTLANTNIFDDMVALPQSIENLFTQGVNTNDTLWQSNSFSVWQAAAFASVQGVDGESSLGNDLGLEVPIHKWSLHIDSVTRFEQLAGDVDFQQFGLGYDYDYYNILLTGGVDGRYYLADHDARVAIFGEADIATGKYAAILTRFTVVPGQKTAIEADIGMSFRFGKW